MKKAMNALTTKLAGRVKPFLNIPTVLMMALAVGGFGLSLWMVDHSIDKSSYILAHNQDDCIPSEYLVTDCDAGYEKVGNPEMPQATAQVSTQASDFFGSWAKVNPTHPVPALVEFTKCSHCGCQDNNGRVTWTGNVENVSVTRTIRYYAPNKTVTKVVKDSGDVYVTVGRNRYIESAGYKFTVICGIVGAVLAAPTKGTSVLAGMALGLALGNLADHIAAGDYKEYYKNEIVDVQSRSVGVWNTGIGGRGKGRVMKILSDASGTFCGVDFHATDEWHRHFYHY